MEVAPFNCHEHNRCPELFPTCIHIWITGFVGKCYPNWAGLTHSGHQFMAHTNSNLKIEDIATDWAQVIHSFCNSLFHLSLSLSLFHLSLFLFHFYSLPPCFVLSLSSYSPSLSALPLSLLSFFLSLSLSLLYFSLTFPSLSLTLPSLSPLPLSLFLAGS